MGVLLKHMSNLAILLRNPPHPLPCGSHFTKKSQHISKWGPSGSYLIQPLLTVLCSNSISSSSTHILSLAVLTSLLLPSTLGRLGLHTHQALFLRSSFSFKCLLTVTFSRCTRLPRSTTAHHHPPEILITLIVLHFSIALIP